MQGGVDAGKYRVGENKSMKHGTRQRKPQNERVTLSFTVVIIPLHKATKQGSLLPPVTKGSCIGKTGNHSLLMQLKSSASVDSPWSGQQWTQAEALKY